MASRQPALLRSGGNREAAGNRRPAQDHFLRLRGLRRSHKGALAPEMKTAPAAPRDNRGPSRHPHTADVDIRIDPLTGPEIARLLREHLDDMARHSPPESIHALDLEKLRRPDITFWSAWRDDALLGCAALRELDPAHGEIKSMRTAARHARTGVASALLRHLLDEATRRCYRRLSLETGSMAAFAPARTLYARFGFQPCGPFADYVEDPCSVFMTRAL